MIKPTVGRVVWWRPSPSDGRAILTGEPHAALITAVWSDTCINLVVFDANGIPYARTSALLWQEGEPKPNYHFAEWVPFQIGQAKAHAGNPQEKSDAKKVKDIAKRFAPMIDPR